MISMDMRLMCEGKLKKEISKRTEANNNKLLAVWDEYKSGVIGGVEVLIKDIKAGKKIN